MNTLEQQHIQTIINDSLKVSTSYDDYRALVKKLAEEKGTTGEAQTENLINYTMLNDKRMKRWDKTVKVSEDASEAIKTFSGNMTWLVISESWCGDAAHVIPVLNKVAELNSNIDLKVVLRDENDALMNAFLTNGGRAIPKVIVIDNNTNEVINTYGPRPSEATAMVNDYKAAHGALTPEFKEDLQRWYNKDKGQTIIKDIINLLNI